MPPPTDPSPQSPTGAAPGPRPRGRPRAFDEEAFLDTAIGLFSRHGFAGVSLSDLTAASGLTTGSLYKAYGDKEGIFAGALERYIARRDAELGARLQALPDARARVAALLRFYVGLSQGEEGRLGCMVVSGLADLGLVGGAAGLLHRQLATRRLRLEELLRQGRHDGSLPAEPGSEATRAELLLALLQGMRVLGKAEALTRSADDIVAGALRLLD